MLAAALSLGGVGRQVGRVSYDRRTIAELAGLSDADIVRVAAVAGLGPIWAQLANTRRSDLISGVQRAVWAVRVAIGRQPRDFADSLRRYWESEVAGNLTSASGTELPQLVRNLGESLGPAVARALLAAVAGSRLDHNDEIATKLDELCAVAGSGESIPPDGQQAGSSEPVAVGDLRDLRGRVQALAEEGRAFARRLRTAAEAMDRGQPADVIGDRPDLWSASVRAQLISDERFSGAENLVDLDRRLEALEVEQSQRSERAKQALETIEFLSSRSMSDLLIQQAIAELGFSSVAEVRTLVGVPGPSSRSPGESDEPNPLIEPVVDEAGDEVLAGDHPCEVEDSANSAELGLLPPADQDRSDGDPSSSEPQSPADTHRERSAEPSNPSIGTAGDEAADAADEVFVSDRLSEAEVHGRLGNTTESGLLPPVDSVRSGVDIPAAEESHEPAPSIPLPPNEASRGRPVEQLNGPSDAHVGAAREQEPTVVVEERSATAELPLPDFPWDEGEPPLIGRLLLERRYALAIHVATATGESPARLELLSLICAAARCSRDALELSLPNFLPDETAIEQFGVDEVRVLLAAALRAGRRLGYAPLGVIGLVERAELSESLQRDIVRALADAVQRGTRAGRSVGDASLPIRWTELGDEARAIAVRLRERALKYQRASAVLHYLVSESQPVGKALADAIELTGNGVAGAESPAWAEIEVLARELDSRSRRRGMIVAADSKVSTAQQTRNPITARPLGQLNQALIDVGDVLRRMVTIRRAILEVEDIEDIEFAHDLAKLLAAPLPTVMSRTVGDAALADLVACVREDAADPDGVSVAAELDRELLAVYEIPRDADGRPKRKATRAEVALALHTRPPGVVVAGMIAKGDIDAARRFLGDRGLESDGFDDEIRRAADDANRRHREALARAEVGAARLRSLYKDDFARTLSGRIDRLRHVATDRYDLAIGPLEAIAAEAEEALQGVRAELLARTDKVADADAKARILDRLNHGDEALAVDFLTAVEAGRALPAADVPQGDDFAEFFPRLVDIATTAERNGTGSIEAVRAALGTTGAPEDRILEAGLRDWATIKDERRAHRDTAFKVALANVLRMIGLVPKTTRWLDEISRTTRSGYATFQVAAYPVDRSYVPQFGTEAGGSYDLTLAWDRVSVDRLLSFVGERRKTRANIILYFGVIGSKERLKLRGLTQPAAKGFSPLVIDEPVIGWLSTRRESGWRFTQRLTLPFTTINPYNPFAAGEVPSEVFVGRAQERSQIESPTGSAFVYGGRQLGKSALLRRVEKLFNDDPTRRSPEGSRIGRVAVYIDLKAEGIGEALEAAALWPLVADKLNAAGVILSEGGRLTRGDTVTSRIKRWLDTDPANRLLLLLDEADNFLTVDSRGGSQGRGGFAVLLALRDLSQGSERRFKSVFAGLHQVQRFQGSNDTTAQFGGGSDILIGPLRSSDAYRLVIDPTRALGYTFESPELVWRLLLVTNYQASLVQIVCEALVRHLHDRQLPSDGGRVTVGDSDVRAVCNNPVVRDLIAQRFRWTINLDSRYRVIALVVAMRSLSDELAATFTVEDLRDDCATYWSVGFSPEVLSRREFERYLVEMVGLGVLYQRDDSFGLRSPNIVGMLGSPSSIENELQEAHLHLEPAVEYNPAMARQIIGKAEGIALPRSPLTDEELTRLLTHDPLNPVQVVFGSAALAIERAAGVLRSSAEFKGIPCVAVDNPNPEQLQGNFGKRRHFVIDLVRAESGVDLAAVIDRAKRRNVTATIVVGPAMADSVRSLTVPVLRLHRWSVDGLRSWYGSPFDQAELRRRLHETTSGWPKLVERAMRHVERGRSPERALTELTAELARRDVAQDILAESAIDPEVARIWTTWFAQSSPDRVLIEPVPLVDLTEAFGRDCSELLRDLEELDLVTSSAAGWLLDRVVAAAALAVAAG